MVALDGWNFAELEPLDYIRVIFRFEYIGTLERELMGSIVTREARHAGGNASYAALNPRDEKFHTTIGLRLQYG
jgi:hypothetical protein